MNRQDAINAIIEERKQDADFIRDILADMPDDVMLILSDCVGFGIPAIHQENARIVGATVIALIKIALQQNISEEEIEAKLDEFAEMEREQWKEFNSRRGE